MTILSKLKLSLSSADKSENHELNDFQKQQVNEKYLEQFVSAHKLSVTPSIVIDSQNKIVSCNAQWQKVLNGFSESIDKDLMSNLLAANIEGQSIDSIWPSLANMPLKAGKLHNANLTIGANNFDLSIVPLCSPLNGNSTHVLGANIEWGCSEVTHKREAILAALLRSQAFIEFTPDGIIKDANENFIQAMGYPLADIKGKHHKMFVPESIKNSLEYKSFGPSLKNGSFVTDEFHRINKAGEDMWLSLRITLFLMNQEK